MSIFRHFDVQNGENTAMNQTLKNTTQVSTDLTVAGQLTSQELQQAAADGFQSILDLQPSCENNYPMDEESWALSARLNYINTPMQAAFLTEDLIYDLFLQIGQLPKPLLIHGSSDLTSSNNWLAHAYTIALMYIAIQEGLTSAQALDRATVDGFEYSQYPALKEILSLYVDTH